MMIQSLPNARWLPTFLNLKKKLLLASLILGVLAANSHLPAAELRNAYPDQDEKWRQSLNSSWKFNYLAGSSLGAHDEFYRPAFEDREWKNTPVPSHWELHGFAPPKYKHVDKGLGLYRHTFRVPASWKGRRVFLRFEGVLYGFDAWINGQPIGSWASSYNPSTFEVTDALKPGSDNLLAVKVTTRSKGYDFDQNDCWALSGIYRNVELFCTPQTYLEDYTAQSSLNPDGSADVRIQAVVSGLTGRDTVSVAGSLASTSGESIPGFELSLARGSSGAAQGETTLKLKHPLLWTAETPNLYQLELKIQAEGKTVQKIRERIGVRQVAIQEGVLQLNGKPLKLRGVDHHDIWPREGRTATEALLRHDLELMRGANINFIRTSHYPPDRRLIEYCDEMGIYVMCEVPFGFGDEHLTDPSYQETLFTRARATIRRDKNRASIIVWSVGNENPITTIQLETGREVKRLDPTRPICFPTSGSYFANHFQLFPEFVDIYSPHYPVISKLREYAEQLTRPVIMTEYAHALGLAADRIQDEWQIMYDSPRLAGGAVWMFQDQGILLATNSPVDRSLPTKYVWTDPRHYYDTSGTDGMDGIVYSDRTPQVDYWQVRKVYSAVQIAQRALTVHPGPQEVALDVENRHDFRSLSGMSLSWALRENHTTIQKGQSPLRAAARAHESILLKLELPADLSRGVCSLEVKILNEAGKCFYERGIRLDAAGLPGLTDRLMNSLDQAGGLKVEEAGKITRVVHRQFELVLARDTGEIEIRSRDGRKIATGPYPHIGRRFTVAEEIRARSTPIWRGNYLREREVSGIEVTRTPEGVRVIVRANYRRPDEPAQAIAAEHQLLITDRGEIEVTFDYKAPGAQGTLLEFGTSFLMPQNDSEFRWIGQGPFAGYPGKDRLNEFGLYHLNREDIRFQGNRREVQVGLLSNPRGEGLALAGNDLEVAVENTSEGIVLSQNALVSGRGNKGGGPETPVRADQLANVSGKFKIIVVGNTWPEPLAKWFGKPGAKAEVQAPFYYSYDQ